MDLPRLRTPPSVTDVQSTSAVVTFSPWHSDTDDGSEQVTTTDGKHTIQLPVTGYFVDVLKENSDTWSRVHNISNVLTSAEITSMCLL